MVVESVYKSGLRTVALLYNTLLYTLWLVISRVVPSSVGAHREMFISTSLRSFLFRAVTKVPSERHTMKMDGHNDRKGDKDYRSTPHWPSAMSFYRSHKRTACLPLRRLCRRSSWQGLQGSRKRVNLPHFGPSSLPPTSLQKFPNFSLHLKRPQQGHQQGC